MLCTDTSYDSEILKALLADLPLVAHRSLASCSSPHRRVIYAEKLPNKTEW